MMVEFAYFRCSPDMVIGINVSSTKVNYFYRLARLSHNNDKLYYFKF